MSLRALANPRYFRLLRRFPPRNGSPYARRIQNWCYKLLISNLLVALFTVKLIPDTFFAPLRVNYPWPILPRRIMPNMLCMGTLQVGNPIVKLVFMKSNYLPFHNAWDCLDQTRLIFSEPLPFPGFHPQFGLISYQILDKKPRASGWVNCRTISGTPLLHLHS
jgi:hypothetical protein